MERGSSRDSGQGQGSLTRVLATTVLGTLLPGTGLLVAGRRKTGAAVLTGFALLVGGGAYIAVTSPQTFLRWSVQPEALLAFGVALPALGLLWALTIVATYRSARTARAPFSHRLVGSVTVIALVAAIALPYTVAGRYALVQRSVIEDVFDNAHVPMSQGMPAGVPNPSSGIAPTPSPTSAAPAATVVPTTSRRSATRSPVRTPADRWKGRTRVNVLLLGGDGGPDRVGVRTDTVIVASINTRTGDIVLLSLPRNLQRIPFQRGSVLAKAYPHGIYDGPGDPLEWMLTAVYHNVPRAHPGLLTGKDPGAQATKLAVAGALRMKIDYYALVNLKGFVRLVDALGGINVDVNNRVAIGGEEAAGLRPHSWIERGPDQHLDGFNALWFARGRYGASDWDRMERQRCVIKAIVDRASPVRLLTRYEPLARTAKQILTTDVPTDMLPAFVDLALKAKDADLTAVTFTSELIKPARPDYTQIRALARDAIRDSGKGRPSGGIDSLSKVCAYH
jgi:polyisoprenyl-teichoic acid--peptidoglycan teichoic acid transferase